MFYNNNDMRILAVDPGSKHIGVALSDSTGTIASSLKVFDHISRVADAAAVVQLAKMNQAVLIVIGQALDMEGKPNFEGRRSERFARVVKDLTNLPVVLWDESFSTKDARAARIKMGVSRRKRSGHLDSLAAVIILQSYIDAEHEKKEK
jgi:putative holliday junction resolvase